MFNDYISSKDRLSNSLQKWVREDLKSGLIYATMIISFIVILTQPGVVI